MKNHVFIDDNYLFNALKRTILLLQTYKHNMDHEKAEEIILHLNYISNCLSDKHKDQSPKLSLIKTEHR